MNVRLTLLGMALLFIVGGTLNLVLPGFLARINRRFHNRFGQLDRLMPPGFYSSGFMRIVGVIALIVGAVFAVIALVYPLL